MRRGLLISTMCVLAMAIAAAALAQGPAITLDKTVGTVPAVCAPTDTITVSTGTEVYYCYTVENTGDVTFEFHDLVDDQLGTILDNVPYTLAPGATFEHIQPFTVPGPVVNTATWTAVDALGGYSIDDTIAYNFEDISATGTAFALGDDQVSAALPLGFNFDFYDTIYSAAYVSSNGFVALEATTNSGCCTGQTLPDPNPPNGLVAGWWEDLDPGEAGAALYYETLGTAPNRRFIVQFSNVQHFPSGNPVTMEYKLFEGSNIIEVHYQAAPSDGGFHTAGVENQDGTVAAQYYNGTAALGAPLAVRYTPTVAQEASAQDTATVLVSDPDITVSPPSLFSSQNVNTVTQQVMTIGNVGTADLDWSILEAAPIEIPASDGDFPRGSAPPSAGRAPQAGEAAPPSGPPLISVRGETAFAPGIDLNTFVEELYSFDTDTPQTLSVIGPAPAFYVGSDFVNNDFTTAYTMDADNNQLVAIDVATGAVTPIGPSTPSGNWSAAASDPTTGTFYAASTLCGTSSTLYTINLTTGAATTVGSLGGAATCIIGIAVNGSGEMYGVDIVSDTLVSINKTTGVATTIGSLGYDANYSQGCDFDEPTGTLYLAAYNSAIGAGELRIADTTTGATTLVGAFGGTGLWEMNSMAIAAGGPCSNPSDLPWLSVDPTAGTTAPAGSSPVDVTFDATVVPVGIYDGVLCVESNDPDEPLVEVPVQMEVVIPVELMGIEIE